MKRTLYIALVAALSLILFLVGAHAQVPELLEQELATIEAIFNDLESFTKELTSEVKGNMADLDDLEDIVQALSIELKAAEGKLVGLREETNRITNLQEQFKARIAALEMCCSELTVDLSNLQKVVQNHEGRIQKLEDADIGTFKKKVLDLERSISALSIKIENNRAKMEGFDHAIAGLADNIGANKSSILANMNLLEDHETRLTALEDGTMVADLEEQVNTLYFISIVALLAGVSALIWGFLGGS